MASGSNRGQASARQATTAPPPRADGACTGRQPVRGDGVCRTLIQRRAGAARDAPRGRVSPRPARLNHDENPRPACCSRCARDDAVAGAVDGVVVDDRLARVAAALARHPAAKSPA